MNVIFYFGMNMKGNYKSNFPSSLKTTENMCFAANQTGDDSNLKSDDDYIMNLFESFKIETRSEVEIDLEESQKYFINDLLF